MDNFVPKQPNSKFQENQTNFIKFLEGELNNIDTNNVRKTTLYDYQIKSVLKTEEYFRIHGTKSQPALIVAPTGSGKSGIITMLPYALGSAKVVILSPSVVITKQLAESFGLLTKSEQCFFIKTKIISSNEGIKKVLEDGKVIFSTSEIKDMDMANLVIVNAQKFGGASNASLVSENEEVVRNVKETFKSFTTLIVDEAHHYPAKTWKAIVEEFKNKYIVFLTATPYRGEEPVLGENQVITYEIDKDVVQGKTIRKCDFVQYPLELPEKGLGEAEYKKIGEDIMKILSEHDEHEPSIKHKAMVLVLLTSEAENGAQFIDKATYCTSDKKTDAYLREFNRNDDTYRILFVCGKLLEGYDNDKVSVCVILRKVRSMILFTQFVGRCVRTSRDLGHDDPVSAVAISYTAYDQKRMWDQFDQIAEDDPIEE